MGVPRARSRIKTTPLGEIFGVVIERLAMAVLVFRDQRLVYCNRAADGLRERLRANYRIELEVLVRDHWRAWRDLRATTPGPDDSPVAALLTAPNGEPFYVHIIPLSDERDVAITIRVVGSGMDAVRRRYALSARESQVVELVLHGYPNADIAQALQISRGTIKKHLTRIFDKLGVHSRSQLQTRLG